MVFRAGIGTYFDRLKGIVREDDALKALEAGAAGIVVSNHGGRQLDHCVPTVFWTEGIL